MTFDYDFFVIGAGSGGLAAAKQAAAHGARVAIAERNHIGGICINRGCIPKKLMVHASRFSLFPQDATDYGWNLSENSFLTAEQFDWQRFIRALHDEIDRLNQVHQDSLQKAGVELIRGEAVFQDAHTLEIAGKTITADKVLIAVGSKPIKPPIPGIEHAITSDDIFGLPQQPRRVAIIGGGYIGVEFACILTGMGSQVIQLVRESRLLDYFDQDVASAVQAGMTRQGVDIRLNTEAKEIQATANGLELVLSGSHQQPIEVDMLLAATGRSPHLKSLNLEKAGVELVPEDQKRAGAIQVDDRHCTTQSNIFAVGDCIDRWNLTPVAIRAGRAVADTQFGGKPYRFSYDHIPTAVFSLSEAAMIGLTETRACQQYGSEDVQCHSHQFRPLFYSLTTRDEPALVKLVVQRSSGRILGAHMVGDYAAEIMQSLAIAITMGATQEDLEAAIALHPTSAEEFLSL